MSTHEVKVIRIGKIDKHPNADTLGLTKVDGWNIIVRLSDFKEGDLAAYIEPDYVVPNTPQFEFLKGHNRITVKRFRGIYSQGLLIAAPPNTNEGDNVIDLLGIKRYEPPISLSTGGEAEKGPSGFYPKYDVESWQKYKHLLHEGEEVYITEKIHGCSARYYFQNGRIYCGSRTEWKREDPKNLWWRCFQQNPWIEQFCKTQPTLTVYGEIFGQVQDLKYGAGPNDLFCRVFDLWNTNVNQWLNIQDAGIISSYDQLLRWVPSVYKGPYHEDRVLDMAEGNSIIKSTQIREGIVIKPVIERMDPEIGRVQLKIVSNKYLERAK